MNRDAQTQMSAARGKSQGGQALLFFVASLPLLFGMVGMAFDIGFLEMMQRRAQTAADAGAIAGAIGLPYSEVTAGADAGTAANGFTNGSNGATVTVDNPPALGPHAGGSCSGSSPSANCNYVEVIVHQSVPTFFLRVIGVASSTNVAARAVATNLSGDCIFALNPTAGGALTVVGGAISVPNCAIIVDSNASGFFNWALEVILGSVTASQISVVGSDICIGGCMPNPIIGATALADPLAYLPPPAATAPASCSTLHPVTIGTATGDVPGPPTRTFTYNYSPANCAAVTLDSTVVSGDTINFSPGDYSSIVMNASTGPTLSFAAGTYNIWGASGLSLGGVLAHISGTGVTFYLGPSAGGLNLNAGNASSLSLLNYIQLVAPTTGTYAGILFFQNKLNTNAACIGGCGTNGTNSLTGAFNFLRAQGAFYFPGASLNFSGCCQTSGTYNTAYEILVADKISLFLDYVEDDYSSLPGGSPIKKTALVE